MGKKTAISGMLEDHLVFFQEKAIRRWSGSWLHL